MGSSGCANSTLNSENYSSPMPVIGLYVAGATLVCLLLIISDVFNAILHRKPWIPCRFFKINSFTLTLLAIASKLPVDLTTAMPSVLDQLSKLCGTQLICISLVFMMPSTGNMSNSEHLSNVASLAIMFSTVVVNISIQMATGVIFSFRVEHIMTLILMSLLLFMLWFSTTGNDGRSKMITGEHKKLLEEENKSNSMVDGLKRFYVSNYISSSELDFYNFTYYATMGVSCMVCLIIVLEAAFRALYLEEIKFFANNASDYKWSIPIVVVAQILTLVVGSVATGFRWLALASHTDLSMLFSFSSAIDIQFWVPLESISTHSRIYSSIFSRLHIIEIFQVVQQLVHTLTYVIQKGFYLMEIAVVVAVLRVSKYGAWVGNYCGLIKGENGEGSSMMDSPEEQDSVTSHISIFKEGWPAQISKKNMEILIERNKKNSSVHLIELLYKNPPSDQQLLPPDEDRNNCLVVVLLVRIIAALAHFSFSEPLVKALEETFEIIIFIDEVTRNTSAIDIVKRKAAKDIWMSRKISNNWFQKQFIKPLLEIINSDLGDDALERTGGPTLHNFLSHEVDAIFQIGEQEGIESMEDAYIQMKQLLVNTLHSFLNELPSAIFKYVFESPYEKYEERIELSLKFLCRLNLMETQIPWALPPRENIIRFMATHQSNTQLQDGDCVDVAHNAEDNENAIVQV